MTGRASAAACSGTATVPLPPAPVDRDLDPVRSAPEQPERPRSTARCRPRRGVASGRRREPPRRFASDEHRAHADARRARDADVDLRDTREVSAAGGSRRRADAARRGPRRTRSGCPRARAPRAASASSASERDGERPHPRTRSGPRRARDPRSRRAPRAAPRPRRARR